MVNRVLLAVLIFVSPVLAREPVDDPIPGPVPARVLYVVDGDTVRVRARIWLGQEVDTYVRLNGVDTAEMHAHCDYERGMAQKAADYVSRLLPEGDAVTLMDVTYDKYGRRVVARLITAGGQDLSGLLLKSGLARPYDGGHKQGWCDGE